MEEYILCWSVLGPPISSGKRWRIAGLGSEEAQPVSQRAATVVQALSADPRRPRRRAPDQEAVSRFMFMRWTRANAQDRGSVFRFDFDAAVAAGGLAFLGRLVGVGVLVLGVVIVVVAAVVVVVLVAGHVDIVQHNAQQVAADLLDHL